MTIEDICRITGFHRTTVNQVINNLWPKEDESKRITRHMLDKEKQSLLLSYLHDRRNRSEIRKEGRVEEFSSELTRTERENIASLKREVQARVKGIDRYKYIRCSKCGENIRIELADWTQEGKVYKICNNCNRNINITKIIKAGEK